MEGGQLRTLRVERKIKFRNSPGQLDPLSRVGDSVSLDLVLEIIKLC